MVDDNDNDSARISNLYDYNCYNTCVLRLRSAYYVSKAGAALIQERAVPIVPRFILFCATALQDIGRQHINHARKLPAFRCQAEYIEISTPSSTGSSEDGATTLMLKSCRLYSIDDSCRTLLLYFPEPRTCVR